MGKGGNVVEKIIAKGIDHPAQHTAESAVLPPIDE